MINFAADQQRDAKLIAEPEPATAAPSARPTCQGVLYPTLPQSVRDGLCAIAQVEPASYLVDDVLDCSLRIKQATSNLGRIKALSKKLQDVHLPLSQHRAGQASRV